MKEYKDEIKYDTFFVKIYRHKERQILMIKLHLKDWSGVWVSILRYKLKTTDWLLIYLKLLIINTTEYQWPTFWDFI